MKKLYRFTLWKKIICETLIEFSPSLNIHQNSLSFSKFVLQVNQLSQL